MKNIIKNNAQTLVVLSLCAILLTPVMSHAAITSEMQVGSTGSDVTALQQFLSTNANIYPAGRVTGYFGALTRLAVIQFQVAYDLPQVGRVGPMTKAVINEVMGRGLGIDIYAPQISGLDVSTSRTSATVNFNTSEMAMGKVYVSGTPIVWSEATKSFTPPFISGTPVMTDANGHMSQSITLSGLAADTKYFYVAEAIDASGNVSVTMPQSFTTTQ